MKYLTNNALISLVFSILLAASISSIEAVPAFAADGDLDPAFSSDGKLTTDFDTNDDFGKAVAIQADGKIVVAGNANGLIEIARYTTTGSLDTTFSGDGRTTLADSASVTAIAIQADGKIVVAGGGRLFRFTVIGILDPTFGEAGTVSAGVGAVTDVTIQTDGKIVAVGFVFQAPITDEYMARFNSNGSPDLTFANAGKTQIDFGPSQSDSVSAVVVLPNGKILAGGYASPQTDVDFALAQYNGNGTPDTSFGVNGIVITNFDDEGSRMNDLAVQPDGKIVAAGSVGPFNNLDFAVARYNPNGSLDNTLSSDGRARLSMNGLSDQSTHLIVQADRKIVLTGNTGNVDFALVRLNQDGSIDFTFGGSGRVFTDIGNNSADTANDIALQTDGKLVVAGTAVSAFPGTANFAVARYLSTAPGSDCDFDGDGKTDLSIFRPGPGEWWYFKSSTGGNGAFQFGQSTDKLAPNDFTGDGKTDITFWRPSTGFWYVLRSEDFSFYSFPFGTNGDVPAPADYDADGRSDAAVFRPSNSTWYISKSSGGTTIQQFGQAGDVPVSADYDGDGRSDIAIYRPGPGQWWIVRSTAGTVAYQFGLPTDKTVVGDYTGDGKADVAFWRPSTGEWYVLRSENNSYYSFPFGTSTDIPSPGDYDGDGRVDAAVFRPSTSTWFAQRSSSTTLIQQFGIAGDVPVPSAFVR